MPNSDNAEHNIKDSILSASMKRTIMFIWLIFSLCLYGDVHAYPKECSAIIKDPLQQCTNLFSQANLSRSDFYALRDINSRKDRRTKKCHQTLLTLYSQLSPNKRSRRNANNMAVPADLNMRDSLNPLWTQIQKLKPIEIMKRKSVVRLRLVKKEEPKPTCNKLYFGLVVDLMPFSYQMIEAISDMFDRCCGDYAVLCASSTLLQMTELDKQSISKSDIIFPVLGRSSKIQIHGYHFSPVYDAPSAYYFSSKQSKKSVSNSILKACEIYGHC